MAKTSKAWKRVRPWIATAAAYALALQLILTGLGAAQGAAATISDGSDLFVICSGGNGAPGDQNRTGAPPAAHAHCALCVLSTGGYAVLPTASVIARIDARAFSNALPGDDAPTIPFNSPTGQFQRGPPLSTRISG